MKYIQFYRNYLVLCLLFVIGLGIVAPVSAKAEKKPTVVLLTSDASFRPGKTVTEDFSGVSCCQILTNQYETFSGALFTMDIPHGWATYQANGFATNLSSAPKLPGAPTGMTGTRLSLPSSARKAGAYIQAGSPINFSGARPAKSITIRAYSNKGVKIFETTTTTCAGGATPCLPQFLGIQSQTQNIKTVEYVINDPYAWSMDNLKWEK